MFHTTTPIHCYQTIEFTCTIITDVTRYRETEVIPGHYLEHPSSFPKAVLPEIKPRNSSNAHGVNSQCGCQM